MINSYPLSAIPPGLSMNITVFSYDGKLDIGLISGYDAIPNIDALPDYLQEAFEALKISADRHSIRAARSRRKKKATRQAGRGASAVPAASAKRRAGSKKNPDRSQSAGKKAGGGKTAAPGGRPSRSRSRPSISKNASRGDAPSGGSAS